jgi:hypothetical protein
MGVVFANFKFATSCESTWGMAFSPISGQLSTGSACLNLIPAPLKRGVDKETLAGIFLVARQEPSVSLGMIITHRIEGFHKKS